MRLNKEDVPEVCQHLLRDIEAYQDENARLLDQHITLEHQFNLLEQQLTEIEAEAQDNLQSNQKTLDSNNQYEQMFLQSPIALVEVDENGLIIAANQMAVELLQKKSLILKNTNIRTFLVAKSRVNFIKTIQSMISDLNVKRNQQVLTFKDGRLVDAQFQIIDSAVIQNTTILMSLNLIDLNVPSPHSYRLFSVMFEQSNEGVIITDRDGTIVNVNHAFCEITGYSQIEAIGQNPKLLHSGYHNEAFYKKMWQQFLDIGWWSGEIWNKRKNGEIYPEWLSIYRVYDEQLAHTYYIANFSDLTQRKHHQQQLDRLAFYDALTGLPNRTRLHNFIEDKLASAKSADKVAVLFLDLDKFKDVNDQYGHPEGDRVLREAAQRILSRIREGDMACRVGGDEFVVVLTRIHKPDDAITVAKDMVEVLSKAFVTEHNRHRLSVSIGLSFSSKHGKNFSDLMRRADSAMYKAKHLGRNRFQVFQLEDDDQLNHIATVIAHIWRAIDRPLQAIEMHYQPVYSAENTLCPRHFEALVRIKTEDDQLIFPGDFIELAEQHGLMDELGMAIFEAVCRDIVKHQLDSALRVAVNLSQQQFYNGNLIEHLELKAKEFQLDLSRFQFEVTETATMENIHSMRKLLEGLKNKQADILLDDFGTGYASLSILKNLPVNILKIDQSFVKDIGCSVEVETLITAIIAMAKALGLELVAEGVETEAQLKWLTAQKVDYLQGYFLAKPQLPFKLT